MVLVVALLLMTGPLAAKEASVRSERIEFVFDNRAESNLAYHAICLTGNISCTIDAYRKLWAERLAWSDADEARLTAFKRELEFDTKPAKARAPFPPNYPAFYEHEVRQRGALASILKDGPRPGSAAAKLISSMQTRFAAWWQTDGEPRSRGYARDMAAMIRTHRLAGYAEEVAKRMGYRWRGVRRLQFHVIAHAEAEPKRSAGTQIGDQVVIEAWTGFGVRNMVAVTLHELFHYFYESMPFERHLALMKQFEAHTDKFAGAYYVFFNEALVSAAAAGVDERLDPENFRKESTNLGYGHPYIRRLAVALFPLVGERLKEGKDLLDGLVPGYIAAGRKELGAEAESLRFALGSRAMIGEKALIERLRGVLQKQSPAVAQFVNEPEVTRLFEHVNVVRFDLRPGEPRSDRKDRTAKSLDLTFAAPDAEALERLVELELSK